ncbi:MAG TPA: excinuclease ABC subunit UvrC [Bacteroidota bacterium]|nr:excinuclease ABC subunit UvrC [Bacteroidota bacterium]
MDDNKIQLTEKLENLPLKPGVYQFKGADGEILYVGKALNLRNRVRQYFQKSARTDPRRAAMIRKIRDLEIIVTDSEVEALILETTLIQKIKPRYNIDLKDDKSFPYIVVTNEEYPRVFATRRVIRDGSKYFGPYTDVKSMHHSLKLIRELYKVRSCNYQIDASVIARRSLRICFDYHIKKCEGPCEGLVSRERYQEMIGEVVHILRGKTSSLVRMLGERMEQASDGLRYEEAAELRDRMRELTIYANRQKVVDAGLVDRDLFSLAADGDDACGVVFRVRDGKLVGRQHFYLAGVEGKSEGEILGEFIDRYYVNTDDIPGEIFLPLEVEHAGAVTAWLIGRRGSPVEISVPKIGDKAKLMGMCRRNAEFLLELLKSQKAKQKDFIPHSVKALQKDLRLPRLPRRIECFDISTIQGSETVASMVVFQNARPKKSDYRKYRIETVARQDDFASMREVIERRYTRLLSEGAPPPDLIVIDGGKGQLSAALEVLARLGIAGQPATPSPETAAAEHPAIPVIGLAKRLEEIYLPGQTDPQSLSRTSPGLRLLQQIRDEAHRFAITYHRQLRTRRTLQTELDLIDGIGKKRARNLLEVFGSVQGVKFASFDQLADVIGDHLAQKIKDYFSDPGTISPADPE